MVDDVSIFTVVAAKRLTSDNNRENRHVIDHKGKISNSTELDLVESSKALRRFKAAGHAVVAARCFPSNNSRDSSQRSSTRASDRHEVQRPTTPRYSLKSGNSFDHRFQRELRGALEPHSKHPWLKPVGSFDRQFQREHRGASEPRSEQPRLKPVSSFDHRFQRELKSGPSARSEKTRLKPAGSFDHQFQQDRRLSRFKNKTPPPAVRRSISAGSDPQMRFIGSQGKWDAARGNRSERFGQELHSKVARLREKLTPPPRTRSLGNHNGRFKDTSPSSSLSGSISSGSNSSGKMKCGSRLSALINGTVQGSSNKNSPKSSGGQLNPASLHRGSFSTASASALAAAWKKVVALLAENNEAACQLEELFNNKARTYLDLDDLAMGFIHGGVKLNGLELLAIRADCNVNGDGTISLEQFLDAVQSRHRHIESDPW